MTIHVNDASVWQTASEVHVNDAGTWRQVQVWVNDAGTWRQVSFPPTDVTINSGNGTQTVPSGASNVVIEVFGRGGNGGNYFVDAGPTFYTGGTGGNGGYSRSSYACSGGQTLTYASDSAPATVSSGSLSITTLTANSGAAGDDAVSGADGAGGANGTASGGNQANTTGAGEAGGAGGAFPTAGQAGGHARIVFHFT